MKMALDISNSGVKMREAQQNIRRKTIGLEKDYTT